MKKTKSTKAFLNEFSKRALAILFIVGIANIIAYWTAVFMELSPDTDVAISGIVELLVPFLGYCAYQLGMKTNLNNNKLGITERGKVYSLAEEDSNEVAESEEI